MKTKPSEENFKLPTVTLNYIDVAHYWGWWYYAKKIEPTTGTAGDYGAPLDLAFIYEVENPNPYPVKLEDLKIYNRFRGVRSQYGQLSRFAMDTARENQCGSGACHV